MSSQAKTRSATPLERTMLNTLASMQDFTVQLTFEGLPEDFEILSIEALETESPPIKSSEAPRVRVR